MKLKQIDITYFRCFENLRILLQPDVNVFVGVNGAGKTAILDAIAIILWDVVAANGGGGRRERSIQNVLLRPTDINIPINSLDALSGRRDFVQIRARANNYYNVIGHHENVVEFLTPDLEWQEYITFKPPGIFDYDNKNSERLSAIYRYFEDIWQEVRRSGPKALIPIPVVAYYRAKRWFNPHQDLVVRAFEVIERHEVFRNALIAGENYDAMLLWYYIKENQELRDRLQNGQDSSFRLPELKAVRSAISKVIGDVNNISFDGNPPKLKVTINDQRALDFEQLSDGYQNLLALVMDFARRLAQANPGWDNPLEAPGILLIDEIELHLHPRWQQEVIPKLREAFPNTQLIVTTHSPQVLTTIHRKNVFILKDQKLYSPDIETYGTESKQSLEDVLETESRPPNNENATEIIELFRLLSKGELTEASLKLNRLVPEPVHVFNTAL